MDPHVAKDGISNSPDLVMDNPLSQNPGNCNVSSFFCCITFILLHYWLNTYIVDSPAFVLIRTIVFTCVSYLINVKFTWTVFMGPMFVSVAQKGG